MLAQEVGQVRDVLSHASDDGEPAIFPTVDEVIRDHPRVSTTVDS